MPSSVDRQKKGVPPVGDEQAAPAKKSDADVGNALRAVYREAVDENVPDEMMDLLKKLG